MKAQVTFLPHGKQIEVRPGTTILAASRKARVQIRTRCGGKAGCLMCKVIVDDSACTGLAPMNQNERLKLGELAEQGYRLACQAQITGDVHATVPEDPLKAAVRRQLERQREEDDL
ncbi:2Fe-2S iron-sulfur cluster-binding protein [Paenibacillus xerothermodurans]|uniref:Ferredoxin n=1 Tax=Paenibacillus xerothermodurans TaxID=1977292 RepID=A0A2W1NW54_PAEXE|nr:2Fe-2S iron-sulfur cluster-binding protein [Paenibacillus xerothermodurans]PZE21956.1 ferredoxin [Paenibacillus xerothermodurans]